MTGIPRSDAAANGLLQKGDVIALDTLLTDPLNVKVGPELSLTAQPGVKDGKICIQILDKHLR